MESSNSLESYWRGHNDIPTARRGGMIESRYARGSSVVLLTIGLGAVAWNTFLYLFSSSHYPILWLVGVVLVGLGLRGLDRRVKLRIGPEGLFYASWGARPIPWGEFDGFATFNRGNVSRIQAHLKNPERLRARASLSARLDAAINSRLGRPPFYINPTQLDVSGEKILEALARYGPAALPDEE